MDTPEPGGGLGRTLPAGATLPLGTVPPAPVAAGAVPVAVGPAPPLRCTVSVTLPAFSGTLAVAALNETVPAPSSSAIVPVPSPSAITALVGALRVSRNVSFPSAAVSPQLGTVIVWLVVGGVKVSVPAVVT